MGLVAVAAATSLSASAAQAQNPALRIVAVDVEGGAATLFVTPQGRSLLIDTGWPTGRGGARPAPGVTAPPTRSSAERIAAAARDLGLKRIDYVLITHYHVDHLGGVADLLKLMPVGTFLDHGPNREQLPPNPTPGDIANGPANLYPKYVEAIAGQKRRTLKAGDVLKLDDMAVTVVNSDRQAIRPLPGAGKPNAACPAQASGPDDGGEENPRSVGILATYGRARILSLGDTTWNMEHTLSCPNTRIGPVDLMFMNNHGSDNANTPPIIADASPTLVISLNGVTKGGAGVSFDNYRASPAVKGIWQLHYATRVPEKNSPPEMIANLSVGTDLTYPLHARVEKSGTITMINPRTGTSRSYPKP